MIKSDGQRSEETVKIDQAMAVRGVYQMRAGASFLVENNLETIEQNVPAERVQNTRRTDRFSIFTLAQMRPRAAGRLGEHRRHTHPLRLAFGAKLVNRTRGDVLLLLCLRPDRALFRGRFCERGIEFCDLGRESLHALHVAI